MTNKLTFLFSTVLVSILNAQIDITGTILESKSQNPIEFAEVLLITDNISNIIGGITNEKGEFKLVANSGTYKMQIIYVGQVLYTKQLTLTNDPLNLGIITVDNEQQLDEVIVEAKKRIIERKIDRLVFNVENSTKSAEGDALEVLKVTPGVRVQNDRITMIGKNSVSVLINDKIVRLSQEELGNFLKSIASEDIKSIEVITTPPAKYEAEGNSGLINIQLKQAKQDSWSAMTRAYYRQRTKGTSSILGNFNFHKNKFGLSASLNYTEGVWHRDQDVLANFPDAFWDTRAPFDADLRRINGRLDMSYKLTEKWNMGGQYIYNSMEYFQDNNPFTSIFEDSSQEITRSLQSNTKLDNQPVFNSINYYNEFSIDTLGRKVTLNLDYFDYRNNDVKSYNGTSVRESTLATQFYRGININEQNIKNGSVKLDVELPLKLFNLSFGGKLTKSVSNNDIQLFNSGLVNAAVTELPIVSSDFEYSEDIQALYFSTNKKINEHWEIQLGLRLETTQTETSSSNLALTTKNDYNKLFPTFYIAYSSNNNSTLTFNYSKRIERPRFLDLNPNVFFLSPFVSVEGNPFLQPAFVDNIELAYSNKNFETKIYFSNEDALFGQVPLPNAETNETRFTNENYINTQRFGLTNNYTFNQISWWSSNNSFDLNYSISDFDLAEIPQIQKGFNARISTNNDLVLNKSKTLLFNIYYWYSLPGVDGIYDVKSMNSLSMSLHYFLMNKNLKISLKGNDIFKGQIERISTITNNIFQRERYYNDSRSVQLTVLYKFGNNNIKVKRNKSGNQAEKRRADN